LQTYDYFPKLPKEYEEILCKLSKSQYFIPLIIEYFVPLHSNSPIKEKEKNTK